MPGKLLISGAELEIIRQMTVACGLRQVISLATGILPFCGGPLWRNV